MFKLREAKLQGWGKVAHKDKEYDPEWQSQE